MLQWPAVHVRDQVFTRELVLPGAGPRRRRSAADEVRFPASRSTPTANTPTITTPRKDLAEERSIVAHPRSQSDAPACAGKCRSVAFGPASPRPASACELAQVAVASGDDPSAGAWVPPTRWRTECGCGYDDKYIRRAYRFMLRRRHAAWILRRQNAEAHGSSRNWKPR